VKLDLKAIRARAEAVLHGPIPEEWTAHDIASDVPALCDRIEELERALRGMLRRLDICGSEMPWDGRDGVDPAKSARAALAGK
jgi:hypothetical protein